MPASKPGSAGFQPASGGTMNGGGTDGSDPTRLVSVLNQHGNDLGIMPWRDALKLAKDAGFHLVIAQQDTNPPVAKFTNVRIPRQRSPLLNQRIRDREFRLIDEDGTQLGIVTTRDAINIAKSKGLDLFVVQPDANPPVAKIMDYGKFKFEQEKKNRETKRKHHIVDVKEINLRYQIEQHDYLHKLEDARKFLSAGDKVKVLTILRGREMQHKELAMKLMEKFAFELRDVAVIEQEPKMEGKSILMILSPNPGRPQLTIVPD